MLNCRYQCIGMRTLRLHSQTCDSRITIVVDAAWMLLSCCSIAPWSASTYLQRVRCDGGDVCWLVVLAAVVLTVNLAVRASRACVWYEVVRDTASALILAQRGRAHEIASEVGYQMLVRPVRKPLLRASRTRRCRRTEAPRQDSSSHGYSSTSYVYTTMQNKVD